MEKNENKICDCDGDEYHQRQHDCPEAGASEYLSHNNNQIGKRLEYENILIRNTKKEILNELVEYFKMMAAEETWIINRFKEERKI
jgi:hypothetical protein